MKIATFLIALFLINYVSAQENLELQREQVNNTIETFFEALQSGDTLKMSSVIYKDIETHTSFKNPEGRDILAASNSKDFLIALANKPAEQKWKEKLLRLDINIDGNMAHVWAPYEFYINDDLSHCGANSIQLFNDNGNWKIVYIMDSRMFKNCQ